MKNIFRILPLLAACLFPLVSQAQSISQNFESYASLFTGTNPWVLANRSDSSTGGQPWFAGGPEIFAAQSGTGYVAANFLSTGGITGTETLSNWLLTPTLNLTNGATFTFYSRSAGGAPDRLEVRLSTNGSSSNVGTTSSDVGDFATILLTINPLQLAAGMATAYPTTWTQYTVTLAGVLPGATGRIAFRYTPTNSGINGTNGDYVGIDSVTSTGLTVVPEPSTTFVFCLGGLVLGGWLTVTRRRAQSVAIRSK